MHEGLYFSLRGRAKSHVVQPFLHVHGPHLGHRYVLPLWLDVFVQNGHVRLLGGMSRRHGLRNVAVAQSAKHNLPVCCPFRIRVYTMRLGLSPSLSFGPEFLDCPELHCNLLVSSIGLLLTKSPNPDRCSFRPPLFFNPTELICVSPQNRPPLFAAQRVW